MISLARPFRSEKREAQPGNATGSGPGSVLVEQSRTRTSAHTGRSTLQRPGATLGDDLALTGRGESRPTSVLARLQPAKFRVRIT